MGGVCGGGGGHGRMVGREVGGGSGRVMVWVVEERIVV